ncbi:MAG: deoxyguanosinetriphosphate triphosphohydrolase [Armatimonadetes bacterium CG06_land_8_20_14_3_00_66_21]|nr:MAG: deoxyguanosinetriphosphate triphosphohydrolase [Armatimonadetes bacterium CG06_land_8_20_14_3_00_66_21]
MNAPRSEPSREVPGRESFPAETVASAAETGRSSAGLSVTPLSREEMEQFEDQRLAAYACKSAQSRGRRWEEPTDPHPYRTAYQRDKGRVIHSFSFRRLQLKTQVFVTHEGDFYRTRLTHSFAVAQIAQSLAKALRANDELAEVIALAHDLGHPPFGHGGERELHRLMENHGGFEHNLQALRVVDEMETHSSGGPGLNLSYETREGLARHSTEYDDHRVPDEFREFPSPTLECQIVDTADRITFRTHDLEDALWLGLIEERDVNGAGLVLWDRHRELARAQFADPPDRKLLRRVIVRNLIDEMIRDATRHTLAALNRKRLASPDDVRAHPGPLVGMNDALEAESDALGKFLYDAVYQHPTVVKMIWKGQRIIRKLFGAYVEEPKLLPKDLQSRLASSPVESVVCDYIAGMTDRYAMDQYRLLYEPHARVGMDPTALS